MCCIRAGGYGEATRRSARQHMPPFNWPWAPVPMRDDIFASSASGRKITRSQPRREAPSPVLVLSCNEDSNASEDICVCGTIFWLQRNKLCMMCSGFADICVHGIISFMILGTHRCVHVAIVDFATKFFVKVCNQICAKICIKFFSPPNQIRPGTVIIIGVFVGITHPSLRFSEYSWGVR